MAEGKSTIDALRDEKRDAKKRLEDIKDHDLDQWKGESDEHFKKREKLHHERRANARKILENFDGRIKHAIERKEDRKQEKQADGPYDAHGGDIVTFDGKQIVEWIAHDLYQMRQHGWNGYLVSGYRTPEYSQQLCYNMCGAPSCPGRCAGTSSNHTKKGDGYGAADVTDYVNAERVAFSIGSRLHNNLPSDLVHLSSSGY